MINDRKLQQSVLDVLTGKVEETVKHPNQQKLDVHEPEKDELTAKDFEMLRAGKKAKMKKEEVEQVDELSRSTLASYAKKASREAITKQRLGKDFERLSKSSRKPAYKAAAADWEQRYKSDARKREAGFNKAIDKLAKEEVEQVDFTVIQHNAFNIALNESYANYLDAAKFFCENEEDAVTVANEFYNEKDPSIIIEMLATEGFIATYEDFIAEGHEVSEPKYKVENNNVYAEYVVKDKETSDFTRYVHHGTFSLDAQ